MKRWTDTEKQIIIDSKGRYTIDTLVSLTGHPHCSVMDMVHKLRAKGYDIKTMGSLGTNGREEWSKKEICRLKELAPTKTIKELCTEFPNHSEGAIVCKLWQLRITRKYLPTHGAKGKNSPLWVGTGEISGQRKASIRKNAEKRNIAFDNSSEFWEHAWNKFLNQTRRCAFTHLPISFDDSTGHVASIDRIDPNKGYEIGNIQWVHDICNRAKRKSTDTNYIGQCAAVVLFGKDKLPPHIRNLLKISL